ncbi:MAG TPA: pitrilysin family protein [Candidatus Aminicenantes bacterium]|nr:pitrilysin family protein [Candidatus Aminicenantes bacterium]HRY65240.1 pitrilysin family protein [Candidatus Aminicenantes bacterium]HRZ72292.1 pitrilysin family protein [Candidatus Aminicenantes bacterium]
MSRASKGRGSIFRAAAWLLAACLSPGPAGADASGPWRNAPETFELANGVRCIYQQDAASPTTAVGLVIGGGRAAVPAGLDGLAAVSTRLLLEIPDERKVQDLMAQATRLSFLCLEDCSVVLVECLTENLEAALKVAAKIILDPLVSGLRVDRARELMLANGRAEEDDAVKAGRQAAFRAFFGPGGYGTSLYGTKSSLESLDRKTVLSFIHRYLVRSNVFFCVQSDLGRDAVRGRLESAFKSFPGGDAAGLPLQDPALPPDRGIVLERDAKQTYIGRAFALPRTCLGDMAKGILLETLLGQGPGSRLWPLRSEERLAYGVDAELTWMRSGGVLIARLETGRDKGARAAEALDRTLAGLREAGLADEEFEAAKAVTRVCFLRDTEAKTPRLRRLALFGALGLGPEAAADLLEAVRTTTREEFQAFVRQALDPAKALRISVGPARAAGPQE